jgi:hypothetical protein
MTEHEQEILRLLREMEERAAATDKSGGYAFFHDVLSWLRRAKSEERALMLKVLLEQFINGDSYAWLVPWLVSELDDVIFAQRVLHTLPIVKQQRRPEREPHPYDITLINLFEVEQLRTLLAPLFLERVDELLRQKDGYSFFMMWVLWENDIKHISDFIVEKLIKIVHSSVLQQNPSLLDYWLFTLCDSFNPDYSKLDSLLSNLVRHDVAATQRLLDKMLDRLENHPLLAANSEMLKRFLQKKRNTI